MIIKPPPRLDLDGEALLKEALDRICSVNQLTRAGAIFCAAR